MSGVFKEFRRFLNDKRIQAKLFKTHDAGQRIFPNNTKKENEKHQLRLDAGKVIDGQKNLYLQINTEAKNTSLKKFKSKHGTHANLAVVTINVNLPEDKQDDEFNKVMDSINEQFCSKIG